MKIIYMEILLLIKMMVIFFFILIFIRLINFLLEKDENIKDYIIIQERLNDNKDDDEWVIVNEFV